MTAATDCYYSQLCDDPDLLELVELFLEELPGRLLQLQQCLENGMYAELARFAHQLKGAGGSYGFPQLTPMAAELEQRAKQAADERAMRAALDELMTVCGCLRAGQPA